MSYILSLDQGTTSSRAMIVDRKGTIAALAQKEFKQYFPQSGYVEHDPEEIWSSQFAVANEALAIAKCKASDIEAIGITNQRETTILWDKKTSVPICRAIVWQDRRTTPLCEALKSQGLEALFREKTGLLLDPYFSGTKIAWILDNIPGARARAMKGEIAFGTVDSWLVWKLTAGALHITDATNASRTLLYNIHTGKWDDQILQILDIPPSILPEVRSSSEVYEKTADQVFPARIPIGGIAGDQQAALFGQGCFNQGMAKATYGTGCFILMNTGSRPVISKRQLISTIAIKIGNEVQYALEGSVFIAGAAILWLRDNLKLIQKSKEIDTLASSVADSGGVYFVPAFTGLGAPHWDPYARGTILGISRGTTAAHIARATLESIAYQAADVLHAMEADANLHLSQIRVDGGVVVSDPLLQFQSDLMDTIVMRPKNKELTALGAAFLAGLAVKFWSEKEELSLIWQLDRQFSSQMTNQKRHTLMSTWNRAIERAKQWETPV